MSLRILSRSFQRVPLIPTTRWFSSVTHSYMTDRPKPSSTAVVEPTMSSNAIDEEFEASNSDADTTTTTQQQRSSMTSMSMSMMDEQAKEKVDKMEKDDWTFEAEAMSQDIHSSRGPQSSPYTDYL